MSDVGEIGKEPDSPELLAYSLWFAGRRPGSDRVGECIRRLDDRLLLQHTPANGTSAAWIIVAEGVSFEILGLAPGPGYDAATPEMQFDLADGWQVGAEPVAIVPRHVAHDDTDPLDIVRCASRVARVLAQSGDCNAIGWGPASSVMSAPYFERIVGDWLSGGPFPALGLVSLALDAHDALVSRGLAPICGQEIVIPMIEDFAAAQRARVAIRMIDHLSKSGPIEVEGDVEIEGFGTFQISIADDGKKINLTR